MKQDIPEAKEQEGNTYLNMNSEELSTQLTQIKEALGSEAGKDINAVDLLGLEVPEVESKNTIDSEEVARLQSVIKFATEKLEANGITQDAPVVSKMSEVEAQLAEKQEKLATAKFSEQITELTSLDEHLDVDLVKSLNMSTEDKVAVAAVVKHIATQYTNSISKLSSELESANKQAESLAKFKAPEVERSSGEDLVASKMSEFGLDTPTEESN
jgi:hypothetical protein